MLVVAIIAVAVSMAISTLNRRKEELSLEQAYRDFRGRVLEVRALAKVAGPSLGTNRIRFEPDCPTGDVDGYLYVRIDPGNDRYTVPQDIQFDAANDSMLVRCGVFDLRDLTNSLGTFAQPGAVTTFAFTSNGRTLGGATPYVEIRHTSQANVRFGFRVLPSGVVCGASDPARIDCDKDPGA